MVAVNVIDKVLDTPVSGVDVGSVAHRLGFLDFLNLWMLDAYKFFDYGFERSSEVLAFRNVWVFDNRWVFVMPHEGSCVISHLDDEVIADNAMFGEVLGDLLDGGQWVYNVGVNGWERKDFHASEEATSEVLTVLYRLEALWGKPKLVVPLLEHVERVMDDEEYFFEQIAEREDDGEDVGFLKSLMRLFKAYHEDAVAVYSPWGLELVMGDEYIPAWSGVGRVFQMVAELENTNDWYIYLDEHCGSCCRGSRNSADEYRGSPYPYEFITWGQSAEGEWFPDGAVSVETHVHGESLQQLGSYLIKYGFCTEEDVEEGLSEEVSLSL